MCAPHHHLQTQRAALSLPCDRTWGDASDGMRKRRQGVFKKSFHSAGRHPRPCSRGGLQDVPRIVCLSIRRAVLGCWHRILLPKCLNPHPHHSTPAFVPWSPPTLPKARANATKTRVRIRQGFPDLVSAGLHHTRVWFTPWVYGSPCSRKGLPGWHQDFSHKRQRARRSSGNAS